MKTPVRPNPKTKNRNVVATTVRIERDVYKRFRERVEESGFVHVVDCAQMLLKNYGPHISTAGAKRMNPRRKDVVARTLKIERSIYEDFKGRALKAGYEPVVECIQTVLEAYADGRIAFQLVRRK